MSARRIFTAMAAIGILAAAAWWHFVYDARGPISASGGIWFPFEKVIDVPQFLQADPRWGADPLGPTDGTLAGEGCAVAAAAMVLAGYGADVDPGRLNRFVRKIGGFTEQGWLYWEAAAEYPPGVAWHAYEDAPSYRLIDQNLLAGNPVIVRIRNSNGITHFVVVVGKRGADYLIRDPGSPGTRGIYPLKEYKRPIEALRFYEKRTPSGTPRIPWQAPSNSQPTTSVVIHPVAVALCATRTPLPQRHFPRHSALRPKIGRFF